MDASTVSDTTFKKLPGVLAFSRGILVTDAELFNEIDGEYEHHPVKVIRHGFRGTQNINKEGEGQGANTANNSDRKIANPQQTDSAKLDPRADALVARFSFRPLPLDGEQRYSVAPGRTDSDEEIAAMRKSIDHFIERAKGSAGLIEVSRRLARNVVNGRWLWRNRTIARGVEVRIYRHDGAQAPRLEAMKPIAVVDALAVPLNHFDDYQEAERDLGEIIALNLAGEALDTLIVEARLTFGMRGAIEVFPSQNYIDGKLKGFARPLYRLGGPDEDDTGKDVRVMGNAAIRDQKVANALRTIDTWYPDYEAWGRPIAVEPNGASLEAQHFFRPINSADSSFKLFTRLNKVSPDSEEGMFCIASLLRGGVYSESEKTNKKKKG